MSRLFKEPKPHLEDHDEFLVKCECDDNHFIRVVWDHVDADWRWIEIIDVYRPYRLIDRLKAAWRIIHNREYCHGYFIMDEATVEHLAETLTKYKKETDGTA